MMNDAVAPLLAVSIIGMVGGLAVLAAETLPDTDAPSEWPGPTLAQKERYLDCLNDQTSDDGYAIQKCRWFVYGEGHPLATPEWYAEHGRGIAKKFAEQMPPVGPLLARCEAERESLRAQRDEWKREFGQVARDLAEHLEVCWPRLEQCGFHGE